jgi:hypothetical protein
MARAASLMAPEANGADSALVAMSNPLMITAFEKRKRVQDMSILLFVFENCKKVAASQFRKKAKESPPVRAWCTMHNASNYGRSHAKLWVESQGRSVSGARIGWA